MEFDKLKSLNLSNQDKASSSVDKTKKELADLRMQEVFVKSIQSLVKYMEGATSKTLVMNQLKDYMTSDDAERLSRNLSDLHETLKTHENTDLTPVVDALKEAVTELQAIPKDKLEIELPEQIDYSKQFTDLITETRTVIRAIEAQETTVEAPVVNVDAPVVNIEAPDLKPITKDLDKSFKDAIKAIVFPSLDVSQVVKEQQRTTKAIDKMRDLLEEIPFGGGSGGGTSLAPFLVDGALPTTSGGPSAFQVYDIEDGTTSYFGYTNPSGDWMVKEITDTLVSYATVTNNGSVTTYTDAWTARASLTFGRIDEAF